MKAIIVFDIDDKYAEKLEELEVEYHVYHYENGDDIDEGRITPQPMPKMISSLDVPGKYNNFGNAFSVARGYNACIKEILGEEE